MRSVHKFNRRDIEFVGVNRIENFHGKSRIVPGVLKADDVLEPGGGAELGGCEYRFIYDDIVGIEGARGIYFPIAVVTRWVSVC